MKSPITTHVLDTASGRPASGIPVLLEKEQSGSWIEQGRGSTDSDGRIADLLPKNYSLAPGVFRITFELSDYFVKQARKSFYPHAAITFVVEDPAQHYHVPLLLSGFGYST